MLRPCLAPCAPRAAVGFPTNNAPHVLRSSAVGPARLRVGASSVCRGPAPSVHGQQRVNWPPQPYNGVFLYAQCSAHAYSFVDWTPKSSRIFSRQRTLAKTSANTLNMVNFKKHWKTDDIWKALITASPLKRWTLLTLAVLVALPLCSPHAGCVHSQKVLWRPVQNAQTYRRRRQGEDGFMALRVTFDFHRVDSNGKGLEQQNYVKDLMTRAGVWLNSALKVRQGRPFKVFPLQIRAAVRRHAGSARHIRQHGRIQH